MFQRIILKQRPDEQFPENIDVVFEKVSHPLLTCPENHVVLKVLYLGVDPIQRVWISGAKTYIDAVSIGQPVPSFAIGVIVQTASKSWKKGDIVFGILEQAEYCIRHEKYNIIKLPLTDEESPMLPLFLSVYGVTGLTALQGLKTVDPYNLPTEQNKRTLVVSSAAGSTGSYAVQVGKIKGYNVVGIVSSPDKADFVKSLGASDCVCYNQTIDKETGQIDTNQLSVLLHKACPEGINVFFDNAGEEILDAVLPNMSKSGDIILCGSTATYNVWKNRGGLTNLSTLIFKSVRMYGIIYYGDKVLHETFPEMIELVNDGHIKIQQEMLLGLEHAPKGLQKLYQGKNQGKIVIKVSNNQPKL